MPEWKLMDQTATNTSMQQALGGALNEETEMWQFWVCTDGYHINWVAGWREQARIDAAMQELEHTGGTGDLFDVKKLHATLDRLYASREAEPQPLPQAAQEIRRNLRGTGSWK